MSKLFGKDVTSGCWESTLLAPSQICPGSLLDYLTVRLTYRNAGNISDRALTAVIYRFKLDS
jgi:hypothetical protein